MKANRGASIYPAWGSQLDTAHPGRKAEQQELEASVTWMQSDHISSEHREQRGITGSTHRDFLQQTPPLKYALAFPNSATNWGSGIQMYKAMWDISHSNHNAHITLSSQHPKGHPALGCRKLTGAVWYTWLWLGPERKHHSCSQHPAGS